MDDLEFRDSIRQILSEARQQVINELAAGGEDEFGDVDAADAEDLRNMTTGPIGDVFKTAFAAVARTSSKAAAAANVVAKGAVTLIAPGVAADYEAIFSRDEERQRSIEAKYADVLGRARDVFGNDDIMLSAFMLNPVMTVTAAAGTKGAKNVLDLVGALGAGNPRVETRLSDLMRDLGFKTKESRFSLKPLLLELGGDEERIGDSEQRKRVTEFLDQIQDELANSPVVKEIKADYEARFNTMLNDIIQRGQTVSKVTSFDELEKQLGGKVPGKERLEGLEPEARREMEQKMLRGFMKARLVAMSKVIEAKVDYYRKLDVPESAGAMTAHQKVVDRLRGMMPKDEATR